MNTGFTPGCEHDLQLMTAPARTKLIKPAPDPLYRFGCKRCPGKVSLPSRDFRGKTIPEVFAKVLEYV